MAIGSHVVVGQQQYHHHHPLLLQVGVPTMLAGLSVILSMTSLILSYSTWRRQHHHDDDHDDDDEETEATTIQEQEEASNNTSTKTLLDIDSTTTNNNNNNTRAIRATIENQILTNNNGGLTVQPIGVIRSVYKLCVGTPRQGLLAPHARGRIELSPYLSDNVAMDCVQELEHFSHVWIVFVFHLNTLPKNKTISPKIAPPALGGKKVGVLATRSPHRFNPLGITLARLDRIEIQDKNNHNNNKKKKKQQQHDPDGTIVRPTKSRVVLHLSGLDLVDGTPVLDIKPYVPHYDSVIQHQGSSSKEEDQQVRLPPWVSEGLATRRSVTISQAARNDLQSILQPSQSQQQDKDTNKSPLEFYGHPMGESPQEAMDHMLKCITEVLSMDVRSSWQTQGCVTSRTIASS
jgi:tRNA (Thr-GGU) A37 N-methylase